MQTLARKYPAVFEVVLNVVLGPGRVRLVSALRKSMIFGRFWPGSGGQYIFDLFVGPDLPSLSDTF